MNSPHEMTDKLQAAREFKNVEVDDVESEDTTLKSAQGFTNEQFSETQLESIFSEAESKKASLATSNSASDNKIQKSKPWSWLARGSLIALLVLVVAEIGTTLIDAWVQSPVLFAIYSGAISVISAWGLLGVFRECRKLKQLKNIETQQKNAERISKSMQVGEADKVIASIDLKSVDRMTIHRFQDSLSVEFNDAEKLHLFDEIILKEQDEKAKKIVHKYAAESALLLAVSPFAMLDMALVLLRNQRMLTELAQCYGIDLGYASRVKLIKGIISNILFAGSAELLTDIG
ncbi:MAG: DUF697 domain-containing protein, partial [Shewanella sp.]|nr:DUF697 domain-containing protein [Shewanella sp.]